MAADTDALAAAGRTRLHIGDRETRIESGPAHWVLPIGTRAMDGGGPWRHEPPTALEIERGIEHVEDAVMPLLRQLPPDTQLQTSDAAARVLHALVREQVAGAADALSLDDVEHVFNQLAALSQGRPLASVPWPSQTGLAAYLVILREAMHHLRFSSIALV